MKKKNLNFFPQNGILRAKKNLKQKIMIFFTFCYFLLFFINFHLFRGKVGKLYEMSDYSDSKCRSNHTNMSVIH